MQNKITFSIILPVYNRENCIGRAVESVLSQTYKSFELIVVDDCSTDGTYKKVKEYHDKDNRIRIVRLEQNGGVSVARNAALNIIRAERNRYICFIDSDDAYKDNMLEKLSEALNKYDNPEMIVFGCNGGNSVREDLYARTLDSRFIYENIMPEHIFVRDRGDCYLQPYVWNKCFASELILKNNIRFNPTARSWGDHPFFVKCLGIVKNGLVILEDDFNIPGKSGKNDRLYNNYNVGLLKSFTIYYDTYSADYGDIFDFRADETVYRFYKTSVSIIKNMGEAQKRIEFQKSVSEILKNSTLLLLAGLVEPRNKTEEKIKKAIREKDARRLYQLTKPRYTVKQICSELRRRICGRKLKQDKLP